MAIIAICEANHSGADKLAVELRTRLGLRVVHWEEAIAAARRYGLSEQEMYRGLDMPGNFFERFTRRKERYVLAMQAVLGERFENGDGIYCGLAGQFLFHGLCNVFKVRVVAPMEYRTTAAMSDLGLSYDEAVRFLGEADERRAKWGRQVFNADLNSPELYDLVVNLEHMPLPAAADMITGILRRKEFPEECARQFRNFAIEKRVVAALFFNSPYRADSVEVRVEEGVVSLSGGTEFEESRAGIVDFVSRVQGVRKVVTSAGEVASVDATLDTQSGVSTRDTRARDVMLPPESYPHCTLACTIREAIVALSASAVRLPDGYIMIPRYVLIIDGDGELKGIVSRRELLRGLVPQLQRSKESEERIRELVPFGGVTPSELLIRWTTLFSKAALEASNHSVATIMAPIKGSVQVDDSVSTVISSMLRHGVDLVPVLEGRKVAGVVLMTNIFDIVAQFILEHGGTGQRRETP